MSDLLTRELNFYHSLPDADEDVSKCDECRKVTSELTKHEDKFIQQTILVCAECLAVILDEENNIN
jgi:hypothetical protein